MENALHDRIQNAPERPEYSSVLAALEPVLYDLPPVIVAIDGRCGVGKTTLGRFLSWRFNISLLETDLFLVRNKGSFAYRNGDVRKVIQSRIDSNRPIIVEGVVSLDLLTKIGFAPSFHIRVNCSEAVGSYGMEEAWQRYAQRYELLTLGSLDIELPILN